MRMKKSVNTPPPETTIPFRIGAPSMVYGRNMVDNASKLAGSGAGLNFTELLLFHTPALDNIPTPREIQALKEIQDRTGIVYTVHLPSSLEIASNDQAIRERSIHLLIDIWHKTKRLQPLFYVLHIPVTPPTLVPVPGQYFKSESSQPWDDWTSLALESLERIRENVGDESKLLIENINFSPKFLEPFFSAGYGKFCLDIGHLLLGDENVQEVLVYFLDQIKEIHLHGVKDFSEHLSLDVLPREEVAQWFSCLRKREFQGLINLEVFSPEDLNTSLEVVSDIMNTHEVIRASKTRNFAKQQID
jgi:sugar phosphate isomerase/epimerase